MAALAAETGDERLSRERLHGPPIYGILIRIEF